MERVPGLLIRRVLVLVVLATLVLAAPHAASTSPVSLIGSAEPGPGTSATLTLENGNGLQVIVSVRVQAPAGKTIDAATLAGQSCDLVEGQAVCGPWAAHETLPDHERAVLSRVARFYRVTLLASACEF
jgi:hypothetical protein